MLAIQAEEGEEPIPNIESSLHQKTQTPRQAFDKVTELLQTSQPIPNVADKAVYEEWDDRGERAATTAASIDAGQVSGTINKTQSTAMPNVPLPQEIGAGGSPRVNTLGSDEGNMKLHELTVLCTKLSNKVESLETELKQTKQTYGAAFIKLIKKGRFDDKIDTQVSDQLEDQLGVFSAAKVLADATKKRRTVVNVHSYTRRRRAVSTGSSGSSTAEESVSTAGASMPVSTAGMIQEVSIPSPVATKDKEQEELHASETDEEVAQKQEEFDAANDKEWLKCIKQLRNVNTFVPMEIEDRGRASKLAVGSSQATIIDSAEVGSSKRVAEAEFDYEGSKSHKTNAKLQATVQRTTI
ncbi:hypothetical protein Tco_0952116 [Tanacetum coccineum]|uniref:Uncharacterized protein n=1 Tax=Tanacetum coccineum TaxID=301880 RepID=A0ABQ5DW31_9ASTR